MQLKLTWQYTLAFMALVFVFGQLHEIIHLVNITGFCILPLLIMWAYEFKLLGLVLRSGFFATRHYIGIPDFIWYHTVLMALVVFVCARTLFTGITLKLKNVVGV